MRAEAKRMKITDKSVTYMPGIIYCLSLPSANLYFAYLFPSIPANLKMKEIIGSYCKKAGIQLTVLQGGTRSRPVSHLWREIAFVLVHDLGISYAEIGRQLGITTSAVSRIIERRKED